MPSAIVITTHNGVALSFGRLAVKLCAHLGLSPVIAMGGVLNEDMPEAPAPVDVTSQLNELGIVTPAEIDGLLAYLQEMK